MKFLAIVSPPFIYHTASSDITVWKKLLVDSRVMLRNIINVKYHCELELEIGFLEDSLELLFWILTR